MGSSFFEFNVAMSGLFVAKTGLSVTSHNIANASSQGYTRQVALQKASIPLALNNGTGMLGTGAEVYGIGQIRSFYLDKKYWNEKSIHGEYETKQGQLALMETVFSEMSATGLSSTFQSFFNSLNELTFSADDQTYRINVLQHTTSLITSVQNSVEILKKQQRDLNEDVSALVQRINSIGVQIRNINEQIYKYELDGSTANDLRDERANLVDELSLYVNVDVKETQRTSANGTTDKTFSVMINGQEFVNHFDVRQLLLEPRVTAANPDDVVGLYNIMWSSAKYDSNGVLIKDAVRFNTDNMSGQLKGLLDVRDGNSSSGSNTTTAYKGIPHYMEKVNELVRRFAEEVNKIHLTGYNSNDQTGVLFFSYIDETTGEPFVPTPPDTDIDYSRLNAANLTISKALLDDPANLSASKGTDESDNEIILDILALVKDNKDLFTEGSIADYIIGISSELAVDTKQADHFSEYYEEIMSYIDMQRLQISGVSENEEMINMIRYQQMYQASSKLIATINEIYDMTINGLGI